MLNAEDKSDRKIQFKFDSVIFMVLKTSRSEPLNNWLKQEQGGVLLKGKENKKRKI